MDSRKNPRRTNDSPIAAARIAAGLTQAQLADLLGTTRQQVTRWETGARVPRLDMAARLADILHVTVDKLI